MSGRRGCRGAARHWFRAYGVVGLVAPRCIRCGARNPKVTEQDRREWDSYWAHRPNRDPLKRMPA